MLTLLVAAILLTVPGDLAGEGPQTAPTTSAVVAATLSAAEISDQKRKSDSGDAAAQYTLGKAYESGNGVPSNSNQAAIYYRKAADQGNAKAQNSLAVLYWLGDGVEKDRTEAVRWYRKAARQGNANAMFNLGAAYYNGEGVGVSDTFAYAWFLLSSEAGSSSGKDAAKRSQSERGPSAYGDACLTIAQMYEKGEDLPKNFELAKTWYQKAADNGSREAFLDLASLYLDASDYQRARPLCETAAKEQMTGGYYCLGYLYQNGFGIIQNTKQAFKNYELAARGANRVAMQAVGKMYENGEGTKSNRGEALLWFFLAGQQGNQSAMADAKRLRSSMTEKEWRDTRKKFPSSFDLNKVDSILTGGGSPPIPVGETAH
jgi:uncharacterized protein